MQEQKLIQARDSLAGAVERLAAVTEEMGDTFNTAALRLLLPRMRQGLVRVAVVGVTSSGKSTVINALLRDLVVPENPNVSSPIPVWIGFEENLPEPKVTVFEASKENPDVILEQTYPIPDFQRRYCYNAEHMKKRDMDTFSRVRCGSVSISSPCLSTGMVLIDTLGISATDIDKAKTLSVLEEGVDLVLFITKNVSFNQTEIEFLQEDVLGVLPERRQVVHPVAPENILFVINPFGIQQGPVIGSAVEASIQKVFAKSNLSDDAFARILRDNVYQVHALKGRYVLCGAYPYVERAPEGATDKERAFLEKQENAERSVLSKFSKEDLLSASGIQTLTGGVLAHVRDLSYGQNSAVVHRTRELTELTKKVLLAAGERVSGLQNKAAALQKTRQTFQSQKQEIQKEKQAITTVLDKHKQAYIASLSKVYQATYKIMVNECVGFAAAMPMPPTFQLRWGQFKHLDDQQKRDYVCAFLPALKKQIQEYCVETVKKQLSLNEPGRILETSRQYIENCGIALATRVSALEQSGAGSLGLSLPTQSSVEALYGQLKSTLEESMANAINQSLANAGYRFDQVMAQHVANINWGWLWGLLPHGAKALWNKTRDAVLLPLAKQLVGEVGMIASGTGAAQSDLAKQVSDSYDRIKDKLRDNLTELSVRVQIRLENLDEQIRKGQEPAEAELRKYQDLKRRCDKLIQEFAKWNEAFLAEK